MTDTFSQAERNDWRYEVANGDTVLGLFEWAKGQLHRPSCQHPGCTGTVVPPGAWSGREGNWCREHRVYTGNTANIPVIVHVVLAELAGPWGYRDSKWQVTSINATSDSASDAAAAALDHVDDLLNHDCD